MESKDIVFTYTCGKTPCCNLFVECIICCHQCRVASAVTQLPKDRCHCVSVFGVLFAMFDSRDSFDGLDLSDENFEILKFNPEERHPRPGFSMQVTTILYVVGSVVLIMMIVGCCCRGRSRNGRVLNTTPADVVVVSSSYPQQPAPQHYPPYPPGPVVNSYPVAQPAPYPAHPASYPAHPATYPAHPAHPAPAAAPAPYPVHPPAPAAFPAHFTSAPSAPDPNALPPSYEQAVGGATGGAGCPYPEYKHPPYNPGATH